MTAATDSTAEWLGATATCAAVLVALFGPSLNRWWRRPDLSLQQNTDALTGEELIFADDSERSRVRVVTVLVTNHGRTQADQVEAILTAHERVGPILEGGPVEIPAFDVPIVSRGALQFELGKPDDPRIDLPPKSSRALQFVMLGKDATLREELTKRDEAQPAHGHRVAGLFCVLPAPYADRDTAIADDLEAGVGVEIQLQARNAKPTTWKTRIKVYSWDLETDVPRAGVSLAWLEPLRRSRPRTPPTRRRKWLAEHALRRLWNDWRTKRQLQEVMAESFERPPDDRPDSPDRGESAGG